MPKVNRKKISLNIDHEEIKQMRASTSLSSDILTNVCDQIDDGLYLGDFCAANDIVKMSQFDVIINITNQESLKFDGKLHIHVPLEDSSTANIKPVFDWCVPRILHFLSEGKKVFVHCHAGISRSASVVIATLMKKNGWNYDDTLQFVKSKRRQMTCPNFGFMYVLENLDN